MSGCSLTFGEGRPGSIRTLRSAALRGHKLCVPWTCSTRRRNLAVPGSESARTVMRMSAPRARGKGRGNRGGSLCTLCSQSVTQYVAVVVVLKREGHLGACVFPNA